MSVVLLLEDDTHLGETLSESLQSEGHSVFWSRTIEDAQKVIDEQRCDLAVLDVGLPDGSAMDWVARIRNESQSGVHHFPVVFITAQSGPEERLQGYEIGAEEFIPKPFHLKELLLRVRHVLSNHVSESRIELADRSVDLAARIIVHSDGRKDRMSDHDARVLRILFHKSPNAVHRDELLNEVWGEDAFPSNRTVDNSIVRLRQLLGDTRGGMIQSVRGVGYQWIQSEI